MTLFEKEQDHKTTLSVVRNIWLTSDTFPSAVISRIAGMILESSRAVATECVSNSKVLKVRQAASLAKLANLLIVFCKFCNFLAGSFSAVSKRNFARKYAFDSIFQALHDLHPFAPLQSQNFRKKSV